MEECGGHRFPGILQLVYYYYEKKKKKFGQKKGETGELSSRR